MIDSHALVGSCAQIGRNCHISAAAQIGGVLEPIGAMPVIVEDEVLDPLASWRLQRSCKPELAPMAGPLPDGLRARRLACHGPRAGHREHECERLVERRASPVSAEKPSAETSRVISFCMRPTSSSIGSTRVALRSERGCCSVRRLIPWLATTASASSLRSDR